MPLCPAGGDTSLGSRPLGWATLGNSLHDSPCPSEPNGLAPSLDEEQCCWGGDQKYPSDPCQLESLAIGVLFAWSSVYRNISLISPPRARPQGLTSEGSTLTTLTCLVDVVSHKLTSSPENVTQNHPIPHPSDHSSGD
uniref:Uncharacterized protein n=1 Tax=Molossus molossus TaxID=27622 RepID=A0A7J8I9P5_MOLMO|nr:hypothetical protein HJG59_010614 [Molossus molossus]